MPESDRPDWLQHAYDKAKENAEHDDIGKALGAVGGFASGVVKGVGRTISNVAGGVGDFVAGAVTLDPKRMLGGAWDATVGTLGAGGTVLSSGLEGAGVTDPNVLMGADLLGSLATGGTMLKATGASVKGLGKMAGFGGSAPKGASVVAGAAKADAAGTVGAGVTSVTGQAAGSAGVMSKALGSAGGKTGGTVAGVSKVLSAPGAAGAKVTDAVAGTASTAAGGGKLLKGGQAATVADKTKGAFAKAEPKGGGKLDRALDRASDAADILGIGGSSGPAASVAPPKGMTGGTRARGSNVSAGPSVGRSGSGPMYDVSEFDAPDTVNDSAPSLDKLHLAPVPKRPIKLNVQRPTNLGPR